MQSMRSAMSWKGGRRRLERAVLSLFAALALAVAMGSFAATPSSAVYATGGAGLYQGSINWFVWGASGTTINNNTTYTNDTIIAGATLRVSCTVANLKFYNSLNQQVSGSLKAYRSGSWWGDSFDNLYNIGGADTEATDWVSPNTMVAGMVVESGLRADYDVDCSATLNGTAFPLQGLVVADAEASNSISAQEWIQATPHQTATWRLLDSWNPTVDQSDITCDTTAYARRTSSTVRLFPDYDECFATPSGVLVMEGATGADVVLKGGGQTAVALGVMIAADFGDAPASFGQAGSLFQPSWTGGTLTDNYSNPIAKGPSATTTPIARATQVSPTQTVLGSLVDGESASWTSANASGDDTHGVDDEDAIAAQGTVLVVAGQTYTIPSVACAGPGYVAGWIDWNGNGTFDTGERSGVVPCTGSSVTLSWTVPADVQTTAASFLRLRIADTSAAAGVATGMTVRGEVEDHPIGVRRAVPGIQVVKSANTTAVVGSAPVTYTYKLTNTGTEPMKTVTLSDDKCPSPTFVSGDTNSSTTLDLTETWTYSCTQTLSYPTNAPSVTNIATASGIGTVSGLPATDTDQVIVTVSATPAAINVAKTAVGVAASDPYDGTFIATYTVTATNSGQVAGSYGALTDTPGFSSAVTVIGASWTTSGTGAPAGGSATGGGPYTLAPAATALGAGVTHTYTVAVTFEFAGAAAANACDGTTGHGLFNVAQLPTGQEPDTSDNSACITPPAVYPIHVSKLGRNCDVGVPTCALPSAGFALYDTDPSVAGSLPLVGVFAPDVVGGSTFSSLGLPPGDYWLLETKAPTGFSLLPDPVKFSVSSTGVVLAEPGPTVVVSGGNAFTIDVFDGTAAPLPKAGGEGWWPFMLAGAALLAGAVAISLKSPHRVRPCASGEAGARNRGSRTR